MQDLEFRQLIERLKLRSPIEQIVGERVGDLKQAGSVYKARCPFHEERTPSFTVDPRRTAFNRKTRAPAMPRVPAVAKTPHMQVTGRCNNVRQSDRQRLAGSTGDRQPDRRHFRSP